MYSHAFKFVVTYPGIESEENWCLTGWFADNNIEDVAGGFVLKGNYPNPFNNTTIILLELADKSFVNLDIFNLLGRKVATIADGYYQAGLHNIKWDASELPSGIYFSKMTVGDKTLTGRMTLIK